MLRWISYILAILLSVQTFAAEGESFQPESDYLEFQYQHADASSDVKLDKTNHISPDDGETIPSDCQHCCHCHSCHTHLFIRGSLVTHNFAHSPLPLGSINSAQIGIQSLPYRPPKA